MAFFSQNADLMSGFQTSKLPEMDEDNHSDALEREVMHSDRIWQILSRNHKANFIDILRFQYFIY